MFTIGLIVRGVRLRGGPGCAPWISARDPLGPGLTESCLPFVAMEISPGTLTEVAVSWGEGTF